MKDYIFKLGKYRGKCMTSVEGSYVVWFYENIDKAVCSKEYYEKLKEEIRLESIEHECAMDSMN